MFLKLLATEQKGVSMTKIVSSIILYIGITTKLQLFKFNAAQFELQIIRRRLHRTEMSAARLPYYQQQQQSGEHQQRRGGGQRCVGYQDRSSSRRSERRYSRSRSRSRSRSLERQRRRHHYQSQQQHRHRRDSRDRQKEWDREYPRRSYYQRESRTPSPTSCSSASTSTGAGAGAASARRAHGNGGNKMNAKDNTMSAVGAYYNLDTDEPFDKERIHREIEAKLRETLAREGKVYPPPKPEASHPVFANDGSFMELFKKMQGQQEKQQPKADVAAAATPAAAAPSAVAAANATAAAALRDQPQSLLEPNPVLSPFGVLPAIAAGAASTPAAPYIAAAATGKSAPPPPMVGRRRGGKILKTGVVAKLKTPSERDVDPKDFWSLYLAEVNKYKSNACDTDNGKRPLVK